MQVDFRKDDAKLEWNVSIDGKKMQSETYKIIAVLDKPAQKSSSQDAKAQAINSPAPK